MRLEGKSSVVIGLQPMITRDTLMVEELKLVTYRVRTGAILNHEVLVKGYQEEPVRELELGLRRRRQKLAVFGPVRKQDSPASSHLSSEEALLSPFWFPTTNQVWKY